jgi:hypothetical protein
MHRPLALVVALTLVAGSAQADPREIAAEKLFDEGHALLVQKRWAEACEKLSASEALAPAGGTELNLGECFDALGKTASAWGAYRKAAAHARAAHATAAETIATQRASALEPRLRRIVLDVAPQEDLELRVDDAAVARDAWGEGLPVDPGAHVVTATRPRTSGFRWTGTITTEDVVVRVPLLLEPPPPAAPARFFAPLGGALLGTGVVAVGIGLGLGAHVLSLNAEAEAACPTPSACASPAAVDAAASARDFALASTVLVVAGATVAAAGIVLFFVGPKTDARAALTLAPTWGGALLRGRF